MGYPRLGHINFLNCLPLSYSLRQDHFDKGIQVSWGVPAVLNNDIMNHRLDVSQVSSITYARDSEELLLLPDVCIRSDGKVQSLIIVSKKPIEEITDDKIILTAKSATTHCLTKIIMRKLYGAQPNYYVRHVDAQQEVPEDAIYCPHCTGDRQTTQREIIRGGIVGGLKGLFLGLLPAIVLLMHYGAERGIKAIAFIVPVTTFTTGLIIGLVRAKRDWK